MLKKMIVVAVLSAVSVLAVADELDARDAAKQVIDLKDGSIADVFDNGKMALENKFGNAVVVKPGTTLQTADGRSITMVGDEVARLDTLLQEGLHS
jgi:hypothetical protein